MQGAAEDCGHYKGAARNEGRSNETGVKDEVMPRRKGLKSGKNSCGSVSTLTRKNKTTREDIDQRKGKTGPCKALVVEWFRVLVK